MSEVEIVDEEKMTEHEAEVFLALSLAWNSFQKLPVEHPDDQREFRAKIHEAQAYIAMRVGRRQLNARSRRENT